ncbi:MAG: ATP-grasp domain-containing protein, partial [Bacteroidota bacterium]
PRDAKSGRNEELGQGLYRGWMLRPEKYAELYQGLLQKNIQLINDPEEYRHCHYLPESYELIKEYTAKSKYKAIEGKFRIEDFEEELSSFGKSPIIVKDYVKSQKHYWDEACYIPNPTIRSNANAIISKFIELQGEDFNEGLVFREFIELEALSNHSISGMPLTKEFRVFVKDKKVMSVYEYWDEGNYEQVAPIIEEFHEVIPKIKSKFYTMDIAKQKGGKWIIIELGDGQVAGLPDNANKLDFYKRLKAQA